MRRVFPRWDVGVFLTLPGASGVYTWLAFTYLRLFCSGCHVDARELLTVSIFCS